MSWGEKKAVWLVMFSGTPVTHTGPDQLNGVSNMNHLNSMDICAIVIFNKNTVSEDLPLVR